MITFTRYKRLGSLTPARGRWKTIQQSAESGKPRTPSSPLSNGTSFRGLGAAMNKIRKYNLPFHRQTFSFSRLRLKCDCTRAETRFRLSAKRTSPFKSAGASVQSTTGSRGVRISDSNAGYTMFRGSVKGATYSIRQFSFHFPSHASQCAVTFQLDSTNRKYVDS